MKSLNNNILLRTTNVAFICFICMSLQLSAQQCPEPKQQLAPFIEFVKQKGQDPVEYFVNLFDKHKIVIFVEGLHPEQTQYNFLMRVIAHPKFKNTVRSVFTEIGSVTQQPVMDKFMNSPTCNDKLLIKINQENAIHPQGWMNANIFRFWLKLWEVNSGLSENEKISATLSEIPWSWESIKTAYDYKLQDRILIARDRIMAWNIYHTIRTLSYDKNKKDKFLVIMNTRHSLGLVKGRTVFSENTGTILKKMFPDQVWIVMWNQRRAYVPANQKIEGRKAHLIGNGLWDAAFYGNKNKPVGFNIAGSPFGQTPFDFHAAYKAKNYAQAIDGIVFDLPMKDYLIGGCYSGFYDDSSFIADTKRRCKVSERKWVDTKFLSTLTEYPVFNEVQRDDIQNQIMKWFKKD